MNTPNAIHTANALQQLRDIHLPLSAGWWPPAPGWWLLAAAGSLCLVLAVRGWQRWQQRNRRWQTVQWELTALRAQTQTQTQTQLQNSPIWFSRLNALLKRVARDIYPLQPIVALSGDDWVAFLQHSSANAVEAEDLVATMVNACWQPHSSCDPQHALAFAGRWLQDHKKQLRGAP
ncbi:MAG: hypothetical protein ACI9OW_000377 [Marinobacter psychrophilus]|jgi:hypothetical protein